MLLNSCEGGVNSVSDTAISIHLNVPEQMRTPGKLRVERRRRCFLVSSFDAISKPARQKGILSKESLGAESALGPRFCQLAVLP